MAKKVIILGQGVNAKTLAQQCAIHGVILCTFCDKEIIETELTYTEDAEPSHIKCLEYFNKHWEDRAEMMDLMDY